MKQNKLFLGLATIAAVLTFASCSSDEPELNSQQPKQANTISFTSTLSNNKSGSRVATTDPQSNQIASGVGIGIYGTLTGNGSLTNNLDAQYTSDGNGGLNLGANTSAMVCTDIDNNASLSFLAYAPTAGTWNNDKTTFTIQSDQSTNDGYLKSDLLKGTGSLAGAAIAANAQAALSFEHQLAQIKIVLENADGANNDFTNAAVTITNTLPSVAFNASTGTLGAESGTATDINAGAGATTYAIIVPQTITAGTQLVKVVLNGHTLLATIGNTDFTFASGQSYVFTIKVGDLGTVSSTRTVTLGNPTITLGEWTTPNNANLGTISVLPQINGTLGEMLNGADKAKWETDTYKWWDSSSNLMTLFTFSNGELANYKHFHIKVTLGDGIETTKHVRLNFLFSDGSTQDNEFYSYGTKNLDMTAMNSDNTKNDFIKSTKSLAEVVAIRFGGKTAPTTTTEENAFSVKVEEVYITRE